MTCATCPNPIIGGWERWDGRLVCLTCIREALAIAEGHMRNIRLAALLEALHLSAHGGPSTDCPTCAGVEA